MRSSPSASGNHKSDCSGCLSAIPPVTKNECESSIGGYKPTKVAPWLDEEDIIPGRPWETEIRKAIRASDAVLICLSRRAVTRESYLQKEVRDALEVAKEKPEGTIYLIPVRLDQCEVPLNLSHYHWVNLYDPRGYDQQLLRALKVRAEELGISLAQDDAQIASELRRTAEEAMRDLPPADSASPHRFDWPLTVLQLRMRWNS